MSRTRPTTLVAAALVAASVLTGCGAGQVASTASQASNSTGGNVTVGTIAVRDAVIVFGETAEGGAVYAQGADAPLSLTIVNEGGDADRLVSASASAAGSVEIAGTTDIPGGRAVVVAGDTTTQGALAPGGAPNSTPQPAEGATVVLTGLREDIRAGLSYPVTFTFERVGDVTVDVPVGSTDEAREAAEEAE